MSEPEFSPPLRLALAYAPALALADWRTLLALDARLAGFVRAAREPVLAQIRLAWWRERLNEAPARWPKGEPLLAALADWSDALPQLARLVDGWEALLVEAPLPDAAIMEFADGRAAALAALAVRLGCGEPAGLRQAARQWALADLAAHLGDGAERAAVLAAGRSLGGPRERLPRAMRPLAVLARLAAGEVEGVPRWRQFTAAIRVGIFGR
ncbi:MAG: hypothetical protein KGN34_09690 [Sphingomonadales bacterium]|nr:hypothetical protein [Sphingomonadales bacterium]